jgi:peptidoglycan/xylan/chitin deacetylase (PgdA/CDA1 family)
VADSPEGIRRVRAITNPPPAVARSVTFSVDCDAIAHYANFAPAGTTVRDRFTHEVFIPTLLDAFQRHRITATFFCIASALEDQAACDVFKEAVRQGHRIGNHTYSHPDFGATTADAVDREIRRGHDTIVSRLGIVPRGYRAPAYYLTEETFTTLADLGYLYDASAYVSRGSRWLLNALALTRRHFRRKSHGAYHRAFARDAAAIVELTDGRRLLEWPIPVALGLGFYGTFHCVGPRWLFHLQKRALDRSHQHVHYELHPIEVMTEACSREYPWLPFAGRAARAGLQDWLHTRVTSLLRGRERTTLETLSETYLRSVH